MTLVQIIQISSYALTNSLIFIQLCVVRMLNLVKNKHSLSLSVFLSLWPKWAYLVNLINLDSVNEDYGHGNPHAVGIVTALTTELMRLRRWWWRRWRQQRHQRHWVKLMLSALSQRNNILKQNGWRTKFDKTRNWTTTAAVATFIIRLATISTSHPLSKPESSHHSNAVVLNQVSTCASSLLST